MNAAAFDGTPCGFDEVVINTNSRNLDVEAFDAEFLHEFLLQRLARLCAQAANALVGIVARECGEIHAGDGAQQPRCLPLFFHRAARDKCLGATLDGAGVDAHRVHPI